MFISFRCLVILGCLFTQIKILLLLVVGVYFYRPNENSILLKVKANFIECKGQVNSCSHREGENFP